MSKVDFVIGPDKKKKLQACTGTFQPGYFTGWGSEGVNDDNNDDNGTLIQCLS